MRVFCDDLDRTARNFIWGSNEGQGGMHLVNWNMVSLPKMHGGLGIREARLSNTAMLGKLVWSLLHDKDKLWIQMMITKYLPDGDLFAYSPQAGTSFTWRSIIKAFRHLRDRYKIRLGNGESSFWFDRWVENIPLSSKVNFVNISDTHLRVRDLWKNGKWALNELYTMFPDEVKQQVCSKQIDFNDDLEDCIIWGHNLDGKYEAKFGYAWLVGQRLTQSSPTFSWKWIWRLPTTEKCRLLVWLICHYALPTSSLHSERGMGNLATCEMS